MNGAESKPRNLPPEEEGSEPFHDESNLQSAENDLQEAREPPSAQTAANLDQWQQGKDDENQFYSIYSNIENLKYTPDSLLPSGTTKKVLIHVNSRNILPEVASDIRMMHRQVVRLMRMTHITEKSDEPTGRFSYELKFWVQAAWPAEENMFLDCEYTRRFPLRGLEYIYNSTEAGFQLLLVH